MSYSGTACGTNLVPTSSLVAHFYQPGDQIEYTLTITNKSTVTAAIKSILVDNESVTQNTTKNKDNITYIIEMPESTTLAPNASTTMKVTAKFQNETDVTGPYSGETKTIEVKINAQQDDGNGGMDITPATFTGTIYRWNTNSLAIGDSILSETKNTWVIANASGVQGPPTVYDTESECNDGYTNTYHMSASSGYSCQEKEVTTGAGEYTIDASTLNKTFYLKHTVVNDIVTASYVCFVTETEHCMQGGDPSFYSANVGVLQTQESWFNSQGGSCSLNSSGSYSYCGGGSFADVSVVSGGRAIARVGSSGCRVEPGGYSSCYG